MLSHFSRRAVVFVSAAGSLTAATLPVYAQTATPAAPAPAAKAAATVPAGKYLLTHKAKAGQIKRSKSTVKMVADVGGTKSTRESKDVTRTVYSKIDEKTGELTTEEKDESSESTVDGEKEEADKQQTVTITIKPNGVLTGFTSTDADKDSVGWSARLFAATSAVFPDKPVGIGDKWGWDYKADTKIGTRDAHADFEITGEEKVGDVPALKIKMTYAEKGEKAITCSGTMAVEIASGDRIACDFKADNMVFEAEGHSVVVAGVLHDERTEGGPLPGGKAALANAPKVDKTIDEVVKDGFEKVPGFITLWRKKENNKETLYAELRDDQINQLMLLQATVAMGDTEHVTAGDPIDDLLFKFTKTPDDRVFLTVPNWRYRALPNTPLEKAVRRSFADATLQAFKIEAKQADRKSVLIDISDFFKSDISQVSQIMTSPFAALFGGGGGYAIDREKTYTEKLKNFTNNLTVSTVYTFQKGGRRSGSDVLADERSVPITIAYNLFALPNDVKTYAPTNGYAPRKADPRIGYFTSEYTDLSDDAKNDRVTRFIQRWDIRKKNPNEALSEPAKPLVFWLDNAIPAEYRKPVREGILMWNKAFEQIGIKNALVVEQMPDNADWDHADMTHNIVRWVISPSDGALAVAQFRTNPLTGQILNAAVTVDANWTRVGKLERRTLIDPAESFAKGAGMDTEALFASAQSQTSLSPVSALLRKQMGGDLNSQHNIENDPRFCRLGGTEMRERAWFGSFAATQLMAMGANGSSALVREKDYTDQLLRETVGHEMGHVLGLRHNFTASTQWSLDQLKDAKATGEWGISASVMDYNAFNPSAIKRVGVPYYSANTGVYDRWAIAYGYQEFPGTGGETEAAQLKRIANQSNLPGHAYQSDETAWAGIDPGVVQYDMSADPLAYWAKMMDVSRFLLVNLDKRLPKNGESYWEFTRAFNSLLGQYAGAVGSSTRYIGGLHMNRNHKGDAKQQPTLDAPRCRQAKASPRAAEQLSVRADRPHLPGAVLHEPDDRPVGFCLSARLPHSRSVGGIAKIRAAPRVLADRFRPGRQQRVQGKWKRCQSPDAPGFIQQRERQRMGRIRHPCARQHAAPSAAARLFGHDDRNGGHARQRPGRRANAGMERTAKPQAQTGSRAKSRACR